MAESQSSLTEMINGYNEGNYAQSLSTILKNCGFYKYNSAKIISSLKDSDYKNLKRNFSSLRKTVVNDIHKLEEQDEPDANIDSFLQFTSLIFDVSTIIQKRDELTISKLKETIQTNEESSATLEKSKEENESASKSAKNAEIISGLKKKLSKANDTIASLKAQLNEANKEDQLHSSKEDEVKNDLSLLKELIKSFDLPQDTTNENLVSNLKQKVVEMAKTHVEEEDKANTPLGPNDDPEDPSILRSQLVSTINSLRAELDKLRGSVASQEEILQIFSNIPFKNSQIDSILQDENSGKSYVQKVRDIVSLLAIQVFQSEDTELLNSRLFSLVSGLFQFINAIGTSRAAYSSLYSETPFEDMRSILLSQSERVHLFLSENGQAFTEDQKSLFEDLINNNAYSPLKGIDLNSINTMNLLTHVQNFLNQYKQKPSSVEAQVLYVIALEAVCACDILLRYAGTVKHACTRQMHEAKQLKDYSIQLERSIEDQQIYIQEISGIQNEERNNRSGDNYNYDDNYYDNDRESLSNNSMNFKNKNNDNTNNRSRENSKSYDDNRNPNTRNRETSKSGSKPANQENENELNEVRSILRKGIVDHTKTECDCKCLEVILEALNHLNEKKVDLVPDERYIQAIQTQLKDAAAENKELKKKNDSLIKETHDDIAKVQAEFVKMNETMSKRDDLTKKQNQKLVKALKETKKQYDEMAKKNKDLQEQLDKATNQENDNEQQSKQIAEEIQKSFDETKQEYEQVINRMKSEFEEKQNEVNSIKESYEKQIDQLKKQIEKRKEKEGSLNPKEVEKREKSLKNQIEKLKQKESEALDNASILSQKYQEIHDDYNHLLEKYQNIEAEKSLIQDNLKNYSETLEKYEKLRNSYDVLRTENTKGNQQFLSKIASLFPTYADLSVSITNESILVILKNVKKELDSLQSLQGKYESKDKIISQLKEKLNLESESSIVDKVSTLVKSTKDLDQSNRYMYSELKASQESRLVYLQLQDWLIRMFVLVTGGVCQDVTTLEMQHAIEDSLTTHYGNLSLSRKNALLRAEKKLLLSDNYKKVVGEAEKDKEKDKENTNEKQTNNDDKHAEDIEEEDLNQSSTEIDLDNKNKSSKDISSLDKKKKKKKDKKVVSSFRHLLIMAMLICKAKRLSGNGDGPSGLEIVDASNISNKDPRQYSASLSPIPKPTNDNFVFGLD